MNNLSIPCQLSSPGLQFAYPASSRFPISARLALRSCRSRPSSSLNSNLSSFFRSSFEELDDIDCLGCSYLCRNPPFISSNFLILPLLPSYPFECTQNLPESRKSSLNQCSSGPVLPFEYQSMSARKSLKSVLISFLLASNFFLSQSIFLDQFWDQLLGEAMPGFEPISLLNGSQSVLQLSDLAENSFPGGSLPLQSDLNQLGSLFQLNEVGGGDFLTAYFVSKLLFQSGLIDFSWLNQALKLGSFQSNLPLVQQEGRFQSKAGLFISQSGTGCFQVFFLRLVSYFSNDFKLLNFDQNQQFLLLKGDELYFVSNGFSFLQLSLLKFENPEDNYFMSKGFSFLQLSVLKFEKPEENYFRTGDFGLNQQGAYVFLGSWYYEMQLRGLQYLNYLNYQKLGLSSYRPFLPLQGVCLAENLLVSLFLRISAKMSVFLVWKSAIQLLQLVMFLGRLLSQSYLMWLAGRDCPKCLPWQSCSQPRLFSMWTLFFLDSYRIPLNLLRKLVPEPGMQTSLNYLAQRGPLSLLQEGLQPSSLNYLPLSPQFLLQEGFRSYSLNWGWASSLKNYISADFSLPNLLSNAGCEPCRLNLGSLDRSSLEKAGLKGRFLPFQSI